MFTLNQFTSEPIIFCMIIISGGNNSPEVDEVSEEQSTTGVVNMRIKETTKSKRIWRWVWRMVTMRCDTFLKYNTIDPLPPPFLFSIILRFLVLWWWRLMIDGEETGDDEERNELNREDEVDDWNTRWWQIRLILLMTLEMDEDVDDNDEGEDDEDDDDEQREEIDFFILPFCLDSTITTGFSLFFPPFLLILSLPRSIPRLLFFFSNRLSSHSIFFRILENPWYFYPLLQQIHREKEHLSLFPLLQDNTWSKLKKDSSGGMKQVEKKQTQSESEGGESSNELFQSGSDLRRAHFQRVKRQEEVADWERRIKERK